MKSFHWKKFDWIKSVIWNHLHQFFQISRLCSRWPGNPKSPVLDLNQGFYNQRSPVRGQRTGGLRSQRRPVASLDKGWSWIFLCTGGGNGYSQWQPFGRPQLSPGRRRPRRGSLTYSFWIFQMRTETSWKFEENRFWFETRVFESVWSSTFIHRKGQRKVWWLDEL